MVTLPPAAISASPLWIILSKAARVRQWRRPFGATSCALNVEPEYERVGVVMAEDFNNGNVVMVATIIGGVVFLLSLWGLFAKFL